jgi:DNA transposition AAA+ family ATPase
MSEVEFIVTKEYRRFAEFCDACRRERYIGLCYGPPGVGKTLSARHYARWEALGPILERRSFWHDFPTRPDLADCRTILFTPSVTTTPKRVDDELKTLRHRMLAVIEEALYPDEPPPGNHFDDRWIELVIVDEADRLNFPALEQLRDVYDRGQFGVILIGMPGIEKRLARYAQFYSRVGFVHQFRALSVEEMRSILTHKWQEMGLTLAPNDFTDAEALAAMIRITGGNFRLVQRLCSQIARILEINALRTVTAEVVEAARENLAIGPLS